MPLANTSTPVPTLPSASAWNVALQHMANAVHQLDGAPSYPPLLDVDPRDVPALNAGMASKLLSDTPGSARVPAVATSGASADTLAAVRVLQAATFANGRDWTANGAATAAVDLLARAGASLSIAPTPDAIRAARTQIVAAAQLFDR